MSKIGFDALMDEVCVGLGFCGCIKRGRPLHVSRFIPSSGPVRADQFAEWVFLADDMNPNSRPERWEKIKAKIEDAFVRHMGGDVVGASLLRWSDDDGDPSAYKYDRGPLFLKVEVWSPLSDGRAMRYNCVQNVHNGDVRVVTADFVDPSGLIQSRGRAPTMTNSSRTRLASCDRRRSSTEEAGVSSVVGAARFRLLLDGGGAAKRRRRCAR